ncbi:hypothetical protein DFJ73DRAFT_850702 [Zopfochytrium polystomum]|nr:hypothetical protein DFJ73DRAFT_850702 [Zopfochytrium polystomum]
MTPQEWEDLLFQHHLVRLRLIAEKGVKDEIALSKDVVAHPPLPLSAPLIMLPDETPHFMGRTPVPPGFVDQEESASTAKGIIALSSAVSTSFAKRKPPPTLEDALKSLKERRMLYLSFCNLLLSCIETLEALAYGVREILPAASKWLLEVWGKYGLMDMSDICFRVKLFGTLRKIYSTISEMKPPPANRDQVRSFLEIVLFLEPAIDLVNTMLVDVSTWRHENDLLELAWRSRCVGEDLDTSSCPELSELTREVLNLPFRPAQPIDEERLTTYLKDVRSRSDTYCLLFAALERHANRFYEARRIEVPPEMSASSPSGRSPRSKKPQAADNATTAMEKMEWIAFFLSKNIRNCPPSPSLAEAGVEVLRKIFSLVGDLNPRTEWRNMSKDLMERLTNVSQKTVGSRFSGTGSLLSGRVRPTPTKLTMLMHRKQQNSDDPSGGTGLLDAASQQARISMDTFMAYIEDIWFQVDPKVERIIFRPPPGQTDRLNEEVLVSTQSGSLAITATSIIWSTEKLTHAGLTISPDSHTSIAMSAIRRFTVDKIRPTSGPTYVRQRSTVVRRDTETSSIRKTVGSDGEEVPLGTEKARGASITAANMFAGARKRRATAKAESIETVYFVAVYTREEVFRFYPLLSNEANQLVKAMTVFTGLVPFKEETFVKNILAKRLQFTRRQALAILLQEENPWIENSGDLQVIVDALTTENQPQRIVDLERLFHSCRLETEVTKEAMLLLRKAWHMTQSEQVQIKILTVVDRLLDKVIMRQENPTFTTTFNWLKHLEETINPYKSGEVLKLVISLGKRAKLIQIEPLTSILADQCHSQFDNFEDFLFLTHFSENFRQLPQAYQT